MNELQHRRKKIKDLICCVVNWNKRKKKIRNEIIVAHKQVQIWQKVNKKVKQDELLGESKKVLDKIFSENQIRCLISNKKFIKWNSTDMCKAVTLRAVSRKCYSFLRQKMGFQPSKNGLHVHSTSFNGQWNTKVGWLEFNGTRSRKDILHQTKERQ